MAVYVRAKRVTDPLDEKVKACLCGRDHRQTSYVSSGSEHEGDHSPCLSDLVHGFFEEEDAGVQQQENVSDSDRDSLIVEPMDILKDLLNPTVTGSGDSDSFGFLLQSRVSKAAEVFSCLGSDKSAFRRNIMTSLRDSGYNAAICKTKWESSGGLTAGHYEFIDVVRSDGLTCQQRFFVDVDFAGEFEIARPSFEYNRLLEMFPRVYVGRSEELKQIVKFMSDAAKRSLKSRELHLPPWRKNRFMQAKWFGPYRRTVNHVPATAGFEKFAVKCRSVGFNAVPDADRRFVVQTPATRTR